MNTDILLKSRQFQDHHRRLVMTVQSIFRRVEFAKKLPLTATINLVNEIGVLSNTPGVFGQIKLLGNSKEDYLFCHAINVSIVARLLGKWLQLDEAVLRDLTLAGLLLDIGKIRLSPEIINKPGELNAEEMRIMQEHSALSCQLLESYTEVSPLVRLWIMQHHERLDGSGYPYGLQGSNITRHAQILAVADLYDAMTSRRAYREADTPFSVLYELSQEMFRRLDPGICAVFLENLTESLIGNTVRLSNGMEGKIIFMSSQWGVNPLIQTADGAYIDLEKDKKLQIVAVYHK